MNDLDKRASPEHKAAVQANVDKRNLPPNPKQAYGDKKPNLALVPPALDYFCAVALGDGGIKYGPFNWRMSKVEAMTYIAACRRHLNRWADRIETSDVEMWEKDGQTWQLGGHPELAHAIACLAILADALSGGFLIDNRPPAGPSAGLERDLAVPKVVVPDTGPYGPHDDGEGPVAEKRETVCAHCGTPGRLGHTVDCPVWDTPLVRPLPEKFAHALGDLDQEYPPCDCPKGKCANRNECSPGEGMYCWTCVEARAKDDDKRFDCV